uniref:Large ribosomal subunit protein mL49 n=1 Tax=Peromyscus maniculatus bairdii TaxID=230844 RepID=A0A8C8U6B7_PERMB
ICATVFKSEIDWGRCVQWSKGLWQLSQIQGPPDNPSFCLFPPTKIPEPTKHKHYPNPSGWQHPRDPPPNLPYFVQRSQMHNILVYKAITHGNQQITVIQKVEGDIWALQKDVEEFLSPQLGDKYSSNQGLL